MMEIRAKTSAAGTRGSTATARGQIDALPDSLVAGAALVVRLLLGGIFLAAALPKLQNPGAFADAVRAFHLLPPQMVVPFALILPWLELLLAFYLLTGFMTRFAASTAALMLGTFTVALVCALASGDTAHACGCFGSGIGANPVVAFLAGGSTITVWDLVRDVILISLALLVAVVGGGQFSLDCALTRKWSASW
jgi:uncharacterized membrane protein YphA (DoxX/SURF4 family)